MNVNINTRHSESYHKFISEFMVRNSDKVRELNIFYKKDFLYICRGEVAEWSNAAVSKIVVRFGGPGVQIPSSPLIKALSGSELLLFMLN